MPLRRTCFEAVNSTFMWIDNARRDVAYAVRTARRLTAGEVSGRWRELAVRLALGASHRNVFLTAIRPSAAILAAGSILGGVMTLGVGPAFASLLSGMNAGDVPTLVMAPALLAGVGIVAACLAGARVLRSDPAATLRNE
jgi:putative ABC transport system permease protein